MREITFTTVLSLLITPVLFIGIDLSFASVMESGSYKLQSDSVNFGGGFSSSASYESESTGGEIATGESSSASYALKAGYQQMHTSFISLSATTDIVLSPTIAGITGGISNGSTTFTVITDSAAGYSVDIRASESPAMRSVSDVIPDYAPTGSDPDFSFRNLPEDSQFGFSPSGVDIVQRFKDNGTSCNTGSTDTPLACWDGLSTTTEMIVRGASSNHPSGASTTLYFRVGIGGAVLQAPGVYTATTTITALPL